MLLSNGEVINLAPQALGETTPFLTTGYWYAQDGLQLERRHASYAHLYKSQPWVATVIEKVAASTARLGMQVWDNSPDNGKVLDLKSPYAKLVANPCPIMPRFSFWRWVTSTYELYGEAFLLKGRDDNGRVIGLYPMHPTRTAVKRDDEGNETFVFQVGVASAGILTASAEDVIPLRRYNPDTMERGLSRLESLRSTLMNEEGARMAAASWWRNMGRPSVMLQTENKLGDDGRRRLKASWDAAHGGADKAGGTVVLEDGLKAQVVQLSAEELQYIESRKLNREEVCAAYDIPPPVVHILDNATFSNITEQMRSMYRDTMAPRLEDLESIVDFHLRPEFDTTGKLGATFALDAVLRGDFETRAAAIAPLVQSGVYQPNEARPMFDLPLSDDPNADKLYMNSAFQPIGTLRQYETITQTGTLDPVAGDELLPEGAQGDPAAAQAEADRIENPPAAPAPAKAPQKAVDGPELSLKDIRTRPEYRAVMGRLGRRKADLQAALIDEHAKALRDHAGTAEELGDHFLVLAAASAKALGVNADLAELKENAYAIASAIHGRSESQIEGLARAVVSELLLTLNAR